MKILFFFFFNDTATTEIYTLSLHDALPISLDAPFFAWGDIHLGDRTRVENSGGIQASLSGRYATRSEEHTSELQSQSNLVCRLLLEKKKNNPFRLAAIHLAADALARHAHRA